MKAEKALGDTGQAAGEPGALCMGQTRARPEPCLRRGPEPCSSPGPSTARRPRRLPPGCLFPNIITRESPNLQCEALSQQLRRFRPGSVSWREGGSGLCARGHGACEGFGRVARSGGRQRMGSTECLNHWAGASQQGKILSPGGPLAVSGDSFGFHGLQRRDGSCGIWRTGARDTAERPPRQKILWPRNANSAEAMLPLTPQLPFPRGLLGPMCELRNK